jgi:hypothetical protein
VVSERWRWACSCGARDVQPDRLRRELAAVHHVIDDHLAAVHFVLVGSGRTLHVWVNDG